MHLSIITHYCVTVVVVVVGAVVVIVVGSSSSSSSSRGSCSSSIGININNDYNQWKIYINVPVISDFCIFKRLMPSHSGVWSWPPKVTWHDTQGHMIIEQWIEYVSYIFESENLTIETVYMS